MGEIKEKKITWVEAKQYLPVRDPRGHKGTFGKVLAVAGSHNMAGAAYFAGKAAFLMGCGMVRIATPECNRTIMQIKLPEAVLTTYEDRHFEDAVFDAIRWADVMLIGPGLSRERIAGEVFDFAFEKACDAGMPMVIDADGLAILSERLELLEGDHPPIIITPHIGEMSLLTGLDRAAISDDMPGAAHAFAQKFQVTVHLKSHESVTAYPGSDEVFINTTGNDGMATAGSGDVLAGIMAGLLAQQVDPVMTAAVGAYIHGLCGDTASEQLGHASVMASDLLDAIQRVLRGLLQ